MIAQKEMLVVIAPSTGKVLSEIEITEKEVVNALISEAILAQVNWKRKPIKEKAQVFYNYLELLKCHKKELVTLINLENGKTLLEAEAEVEKCIELTEYACSLPQVLNGTQLEVSKGVWCTTQHEALGVVACITPFNFPLMVPHWTIPNALMLGNAVILKPSEHTPLSAFKMKDLLEEAGLPTHLLQIVIGGKDAVDHLTNHESIEAISFVGSTPIAKLVYQKATSRFKRCLALGGAKNHLIVVPDADPEMTAGNVIASMSGCAGQRCMAASVLLAVGDVDEIIEKMVLEVLKLTPGENLGPLINRESLDRIHYHIDLAEKEGAKILVDGRTFNCPENGFFIGPTIIDFAKPQMANVQQELFGPVISIIRVATLEDALEIENACKFGNAASVFTTSGAVASRTLPQLKAGMVGVNVGVPVPREPFSFAGWHDSKFGHGEITGDGSLGFWTNLKKITTKWSADNKANWMS